MKFGIGLAAAVIFGTLGMGTTGAMAAKMSKSAMESGSNAADTMGASGGGGDKMKGNKTSGGKMKGQMKSKKGM